MTLGPEVSAPCEADWLSGLSRSCMIRRSSVCSLLICWTFFCYAVAVFFCLFVFFLYHFNCECLSTTHLLKFIRRLRHHPHNVYFLFFLCDAAIYLLKYYSDVWTIVLFVPQPHGESTTNIVSETFIHYLKPSIPADIGRQYTLDNSWIVGGNLSNWRKPTNTVHTERLCPSQGSNPAPLHSADMRVFWFYMSYISKQDHQQGDWLFLPAASGLDSNSSGSVKS